MFLMQTAAERLADAPTEIAAPLAERLIGNVVQSSVPVVPADGAAAEGVGFVAQTGSPLLIKPFLGRMTKSELNTVMVGGFATVAGGVLAAYVGILSGWFPDIASHLLAASVMNAPAGLVLSKILLPETQEQETKGGLGDAAAAMETAAPRKGCSSQSMSRQC